MWSVTCDLRSGKFLGSLARAAASEVVLLLIWWWCLRHLLATSSSSSTPAEAVLGIFDCVGGYLRRAAKAIWVAWGGLVALPPISERSSSPSSLLLDAPVLSIFGSLRYISCCCWTTTVSDCFSTPLVVFRIVFAPLVSVVVVVALCCFNKYLWCCLPPFLPSLFRIAAFLVDSPPACYLNWASFRRRML